MSKAFNYFPIILLIVCTFFILVKCNKPPYTPAYNNVKGYVIGKEKCNSDSSLDYWLVDLTYLPNTPQYGDTLILNGVTYTNVIKTKNFADRLKQIGMKVSIDFKVISQNKVQTIGCSIANPVTYLLKELFIINQFEIR